MKFFLLVFAAVMFLLVIPLLAIKSINEHSGNSETLEEGLRRFSNDEVTCYLFDQGGFCHWKQE